MSNRRMQDSDYIFDSEDDLIGLTSAFPAVKGPQSVEYDKGDSAIGLTGAFAPITIEEDERSWDEGSKWQGFDWESYQGADDEGPSDEPALDEGGEAAPEAEAAESAQDAQEAQEALQAASAAAVAAAPRSGTGRGRHAAPDASMSPRMQKARKNRRVLILLVVLVILIIICVGVYSGFIFNSSQEQAHQAEQAQVEGPKDSLASSQADDVNNAPAKMTDVPVLTSLFGKTTEEAVNEIGHGAMALPAREVKEEGNPIKSSVNVSLNDEPIDSKTGAPTVYLGLNQDGKVIQVGYSASAAALGFGSLSFADAVSNDRVIEKTFEKIGVAIPAGSVELPADKKDYSTYADDGTTVTRERCSFEGDIDVNGTPCTWSAVLSYDYTTQIVTGDLADTVRVIYVYITQK